MQFRQMCHLQKVAWFDWPKDLNFKDRKYGHVIVKTRPVFCDIRSELQADSEEVLQSKHCTVRWDLR